MRTRQQGDESLLNTTDPERIIRNRREPSMATPNPIDTRGATQTSEVEEDAASINSVTNLDIPALIVPDLNNTPLEEAIKDGMKVGPAEYLINTPLLKEHIGVEHLKVFLPSGRLETHSERPIKFVTDCQDSPFPEEVLVSALKTFRIENPITQYIPGDEWPITRHRFLTKQELEDRLEAYCEIGVKYWKYVFELETNSLLTMNNEDRLRANEGLEQSIQRISDRLDEILVILTRDNSRRKAYGKQTYPLPKTKPRMESIQNAEEAFQMGRKMMTEHDNIVAQAFNEESTDIPNATPAEGHGTTGGKEKHTRSKPQTAQPVTATITRGKEQHTVNFNFTNREQHRENSLQDVQRQLNDMAQTTNRATTETDRPDRHDTQTNRHGRQDTQRSKWGTRSDRQYEHRNRREYGSSRESDSGTSTDWDYCSACGEPGHASRNCVARIQSAYNLAKSRAARDGNKRTRKNFRPKHIKLNHPVIVKDHTAKAFEPRNTDHLCVGFQGKNRVFIKDNHGKVTLVSRKDVSPCEMDVKIAELFNESRSNSKIRDAQQLMPARQIPDLEWKFEEEVQLVEPVLIQVYHLPEQSATTENDRPDRLQLVETKTESQNTKTGQEDQGIATIETDRTERSQTIASESSAFKILETLIFLLISLATVAVLF